MKSRVTYFLLIRPHGLYNYKRIIAALVLLLGILYPLQAQDSYTGEPLDPINTYDEVPVEITVKGYLKFETEVIITDAQLVYVNVEELFKKLGIYVVSENNGNTLRGFIENESKTYTIDFETRQITVAGKTIKSYNGMVYELGAINLETNLMNEAFGLHLLFNFRSLSIKLEAGFELPLVKQARLDAMRKNVSKLQSRNQVIIDTVVGRNYHLLRGGVLDWAVSSYQTAHETPNTRFSLGLGSELLYGEAKVAFNYYDQTKFDRRQLQYDWRWVNNDHNYIKQAYAGKIGTQSIAFLRAPLVGASINNSPNTVRKATGTYTISEYTEPNWTVELYLNDVLVDYTAADASGLYVFKVPIVYGYTTLKLKYYGPLGEERMEERIMNTPYTFMPAGVLEYNLTGGVLEDEQGSTFARGEVNYGFSRLLTLGGGVEYLSALPDHPAIPFANIAFQPFSKMVINAEYNHEVSVKSLVNYYLSKSAFLEMEYTNFVKGQQATLNNTSEEWKLRLSLPYAYRNLSGTTQLSYHQYVYDHFNFNQLDGVISGRYKNYTANAAVAANWVNNRDPYMTSTLVVSQRWRNGLTARPSVQYNITDGELMRYRAELEKRIKKMAFSASYERNLQYATDNWFFSFKYDLPYARTGLSTSYYNNRFNVSESAQGSLAFGADNGVVKSGNNSATGKGGILLYPFLDLNHNGKRDKGEKLVWLNRVKVSGAKAVISEKDSIVRISDVNAFINYTVEFSDTDLDNIAWTFKNKTYQILVDPHQYKKVEVPVVVLGEVSGTVYMLKDERKGQGRITVQIYNQQGQKVAETLTESDGYFSYLGLKPGAYTLQIDQLQLEKIGYRSTPAVQSFRIGLAVDGDVLEGRNFTLHTAANEPEYADSKRAVLQPVSRLEGSEMAETETVLQQSDTKTPVEYRIFLGDFPEVSTHPRWSSLNVQHETLPNGMIRHTYGSYTNPEDAGNARNGLLLRGILGARVLAYENGKVQEEGVIGTSQFQLNSTEKISKVAGSGTWTLNSSFTDMSTTGGLVYSVQIGAYRNAISPKQLLNLSPIYFEILPNAIVRYLYGNFSTKVEAVAARNKMRALGIKDAFVVMYQEGKKVK